MPSAILREPAIKTLSIDRRLLTLPQVAQLLQTSKRTVVQLIESGQLPAIKFGQRYRVWSDTALAFGRDNRAA